jgi:hypothetical protein
LISAEDGHFWYSGGDVKHAISRGFHGCCKCWAHGLITDINEVSTQDIESEAILVLFLEISLSWNGSGIPEHILIFTAGRDLEDCIIYELHV